MKEEVRYKNFVVDKSKFRSDFRKPLKFLGMIENLRYRIEYVDIDVFKDDRDPPRVGEIIHLEHDYQEPNAYSGWDRLMLFIGRKDDEGRIHNWVRYYENVEDLERVVSGLKLSLATDLAEQWIKDLRKSTRKRIAELKKDYGL